MRSFCISGGSTVSSSVFGTEFQKAEDLTVSVKDLGTYTNRLQMTTTNLPVGEYRIGWSYGWSLDSTSHDFLSRIMMNGSFLKMIHEQEPKDSSGSYSSTGTNQKHRASGFLHESLSGVNIFDIDWGHSGPLGTETSMWDVRFELWRVL